MPLCEVQRRAVALCDAELDETRVLSSATAPAATTMSSAHTRSAITAAPGCAHAWGGCEIGPQRPSSRIVPNTSENSQLAAELAEDHPNGGLVVFHTDAHGCCTSNRY